MSSDLEFSEAWIGGLLHKLEPAQRRTLAKQLATDLRRSQRQRIAAQKNPDGSPFAPRRASDKKGRIRRNAMFKKLRTARYLKARSNADKVEVGFWGNAAKIARVHQYGLHDRVAKGGPEIRYRRRKLLGSAAENIEQIEERISDFLSN